MGANQKTYGIVYSVTGVTNQVGYTEYNVTYLCTLGGGFSPTDDGSTCYFITFEGIASASGSAWPRMAYLANRTTSQTGQAATVGSTWTKCTINTEVSDPNNIASLSSDVVTLGAGTYEVEFLVSAYRTALTQIRLYDTTNSAVLAVGNNIHALAAAASSAVCIGRGEFTLAGSTNMELQYYVSGTTGYLGFGANDGGNHDFVQLQIRKVA